LYVGKPYKLTIIYPAIVESPRPVPYREFPFESNTDSIQYALNDAFDQWNAHDGADLNVAAGTRSLSVGDMVRIEDEDEGTKHTYLCNGCGWAICSPDFIEAWLKLPYDRRLMGVKLEGLRQAGRDGETVEVTSLDI
jgi:hypothetical protein